MRYFTTLLLLFIACTTYAQQLDKAAFQNLYAQDMKINKTGMTVLGVWAVANLVSGVTGYIVANDQEAKAFWGMNAIWGATNVGFSALGLWGAKKEMKMQYSCDKMLQKHEYYKNLFLLNAGLDVAYIGTGVALNAYADDFKNPATVNGFGKSIALQGIALLIFDGTMYATHKSKDKKWYKLMNGLCVNGSGIGFKYTFEAHSLANR